MGGRAAAEVAAAQAVAVAFERHQGDARLSYRSILVREVRLEDAALYLVPQHRRRLRRVVVPPEEADDV
jgi:hypothetical protein